MEDTRWIDQLLANLEQDAWQPRLAMEADVPADKKTRERTEGAATAVQAKHRDFCSSKRFQDKFNAWGRRRCNIFVPVLGGNGTKIAPAGDIFDQPPGQMR